jgi:hypothetical protein
MAIIEKFLELSLEQVVTTTAATTNVIDAGATKSASLGRDIGAGTQLYLAYSVNTAATAGGAATVTFALQDSADNSSFADVITTVAVPVASLVAGATYYLPLPPGMRRYIRGNYTVETGPLLTGKFNASIVDGANFIKSQPDSLTKVV